MITTIINTIMGFFNNTKNIILGIVGLLISGYILKQKYDKNKAENKIKDIENDIYKINIENIKKNEEKKSKIKEIEKSVELNNIKEQVINKEKIKKEIENIEEKIKKNENKKDKIEEIKRKKITDNFKIEV